MLGPRSGLVAAVLVPLCLASSVHALDHTIPASKLRLKRSSSGKEGLLLVSKQPGFPIDDPSLGGATVELFGGNGGHASFVVPPGIGNPGWKVNGLVQLYLYRDGKAPTVVRLALQNGKQIKLIGKSLGLTLGGLGSVGVRITTGQYRNCVLFNASRSTISKDLPTDFSARDAIASPPLASCDASALGSPAVCGNGVLEADEACDGAADAACPGLCAGNCTCLPPACGDQHVNQASEQCDGSADAACPGQCQPNCQCLGVCGDGIVNQPSEECDGTYCVEPALAGCRPAGAAQECSCCSYGLFCGDLGCCDPERTCIVGPHFSGTCCYQAFGHACQGDSDCCAPLSCTGGQCCLNGVCCEPQGFPCSSGAECCSGTCSGGTCAP
jgi:hypothetical protein